MWFYRRRHFGWWGFLNPFSWLSLILSLFVAVVAFDLLVIYGIIQGLILMAKAISWCVCWYQGRPKLAPKVRRATEGPIIMRPDPVWQAAYDQAKSELERLYPQL